MREGQGYILKFPLASAWFAESTWPWNRGQWCKKSNDPEYSLLEWALLGARHVSEQVFLEVYSAVSACFSSSVAPAIQSIAHMTSVIVE